MRRLCEHQTVELEPEWHGVWSNCSPVRDIVEGGISVVTIFVYILAILLEYKIGNSDLFVNLEFSANLGECRTTLCGQIPNNFHFFVKLGIEISMWISLFQMNRNK